MSLIVPELSVLRSVVVIGRLLGFVTFAKATATKQINKHLRSLILRSPLICTGETNVPNSQTRIPYPFAQCGALPRKSRAHVFNEGLVRAGGRNKAESRFFHRYWVGNKSAALARDITYSGNLARRVDAPRRCSE